MISIGLMFLLTLSAHARVFKLSEIAKFRSENAGDKLTGFPDSKFSCQSKMVQKPVKISKDCNQVVLTTYECHGYCHSFSVALDDDSSLVMKSCCSVKDAIYDHVRVNCISKAHEDTNTNNATSANLAKSWVPYSSKAIYEGYYSIRYPVYVKCECESRLVF
jgi:hypothetical protein